MNDKAALIIQLIVYFLISLMFIFGGRKTMQSWHASKFWPTAPGKVIRSNMTVKSGYVANIFFEYHVNGKLYRSNRVILGETAGSEFSWGKAKAEKYLSTYPLGKEAQVLYNPARPEEAYLERGARYSTGIFGVVVGSLLLGVSLLMVYLLVK